MSKSRNDIAEIIISLVSIVLLLGRPVAAACAVDLALAWHGWPAFTFTQSCAVVVMFALLLPVFPPFPEDESSYTIFGRVAGDYLAGALCLAVVWALS